MENSTRKKYQYWQWRTLIILMIGYALYYFVRKNFSIVMPALESELGLSKVQLGIFLTLNGIIYGLSRFVNGLLAGIGVPPSCAGALTIATMWNVPADGYAKTGRLMEEVEKELEGQAMTTTTPNASMS